MRDGSASKVPELRELVIVWSASAAFDRTAAVLPPTAAAEGIRLLCLPGAAADAADFASRSAFSYAFSTSSFVNPLLLLALLALLGFVANPLRFAARRAARRYASSTVPSVIPSGSTDGPRAALVCAI
jgi:hypothetical protein